VPDGRGFADALATELAARGYTAELLRENGSTPAGPFDVVVQLGGVELVENEDDALAVLRRAFELTQRYAQGLRASGRGRLVTVQDTGGDFGLSRALSRPRALLGGLAALAKTVAQEWPEVRAKAVDVDLATLPLQDAVRDVAAEIVQGADVREVGFTEAGRFGLAVRAASLPSDGESLLGPDDVVVATGGARGVTAVALEGLARAARPRLVLLGRTDMDAELALPEARHDDEASLKRALFDSARARGESLTPAEVGARAARILSAKEVARTLARLRAAGSEAVYLPVDVRDPSSLGAAFAQARERFGPITALVHGAGVLADKRIEDKSLDDFDRVVDTKVRGLLALFEATRDDPVRVVALFSSVAGRHGNAGQVDYAMANEALNKLAQAEARARPDVLVKSFNWGPWDGGMVTPALREMFAARGVALLGLDAGTRFFVDELTRGARGEGVEVVFGGPLDGSPQGDSDELAEHIDATSFGFLRDHALRGTPVLPAVMAMQLVATAGRRRHPELALRGVRGLRVLRGIPLSGFSNGGNELRVSLSEAPAAPGARATLRAEVRADGSPAPRYIAYVDLGEPLGERPAAPPPPADMSPFPADRAAIYRDMLFHGPSFQLVDEVEGVGDDGIVGRVRRTRDAGWVGPTWLVDVGALDAGLQLVLLFARNRLGGSFLPTSIGSCTTFDDVLGGGAARCVVRAQTEGNDRVVCQVSFLDEAGRVLMEMRDVEAHRLLDETAFNRAGDRTSANA
jgi:NAD(P)-dependent dehydrogenase (short-subunit alcohol dehydrogenase family)